MATVRIYKVAELLNTTSQEVIALLKRDHGIEVKSASSTIEEVVARQFVDRLAKQRNIQLPGGDIFAETPVAKPKGKVGTTASAVLERNVCAFVKRGLTRDEWRKWLPSGAPYPSKLSKPCGVRPWASASVSLPLIAITFVS